MSKLVGVKTPNGTFERRELRKEAKMYVDMVRDGKMLNTREQTAAVSLARVTIMLGLYGSKAEAILHVIHEHGHTEVTLADVEAVRDYVLIN